jgi:histone deacetylase HOS3
MLILGAQLEKLATKKRRGSRSSLGATDMKPPPWLDRTSTLLARLDPRGVESPSSRSAYVLPSSMTLRARKPASQGTSASTGSSPDGKKVYNQGRPAGEAATAIAAATADASSSSRESTPDTTSPPAVVKKLPRVILKVGPRPET